MVVTKKPDKWLHSAETAEFLATCLNTAPGCVLQNKPDPNKGSKNAIRGWAEGIVKECEKQGMIIRTPGKGGGTFAHWQIATAYAKYLSPELHVLVNNIFRERLQETVNPELGLSRSRMRAVKSWKAMGRKEERRSRRGHP